MMDFIRKIKRKSTRRENTRLIFRCNYEDMKWLHKNILFGGCV